MPIQTSFYCQIFSFVGHLSGVSFIGYDKQSFLCAPWPALKKKQHHINIHSTFIYAMSGLRLFKYNVGGGDFRHLIIV